MSFSFGTPSSAPASTGLTGGFNFGANKPATPGFGLNTSQPAAGGLFGAPATSETSAFGAPPSFGATSTAPAFGATTTPAFGATTTPAFGATTTPAFGATTTPAFGAATPAFGAAAPAFGAATPAFGTSSAAPTFGTTTPAFGVSSAPTFGATTTPAFGASAAPTFGTSTAPGFGTGGLNFGAATSTTPATGLNFGAPVATTSSAGLGGLGSFGVASTAQGLGFSGFGATTTATTTNSFFGGKLGITSVTGTQPSTLATTSFGLGGVSTSTSGVTSTNADKNEPPKQAKLPNEISATVDSFKEFVKKQKSLSSDIMRVSIKPLHKVAREAECRLREVSSVCSSVRRGRGVSARVRATTAAALLAAEAAATDTQPGSELEGSAPPAYVKELISELEQQLITFRRQMDVADKQMQSSPKLLTEQELTLGIRRMHESLVALAGRLQAVHTQVEAQKEQYLNLRKYILKDPTNVFEEPYPSTSLDQILRDAESNRKKMKSGALVDISHSSAVLSDPKSVLGNLQHLAGPTPFAYVGSTLSPFSTTETSGISWQPQATTSLNTSLNVVKSCLNALIGTTGISWPPLATTSLNSSLNASFGSTPAESSFQLQKPPGKRGKQ